MNANTQEGGQDGQFDFSEAVRALLAQEGSPASFSGAGPPALPSSSSSSSSRLPPLNTLICPAPSSRPGRPFTLPPHSPPLLPLSSLHLPHYNTLISPDLSSRPARPSSLPPHSPSLTFPFLYNSSSFSSSPSSSSSSTTFFSSSSSSSSSSPLPSSSLSSSPSSYPSSSSSTTFFSSSSSSSSSSPLPSSSLSSSPSSSPSSSSSSFSSSSSSSSSAKILRGKTVLISPTVIANEQYARLMDTASDLGASAVHIFRPDWALAPFVCRKAVSGRTPERTAILELCIRRRPSVMIVVAPGEVRGLFAWLTERLIDHVRDSQADSRATQDAVEMACREWRRLPPLFIVKPIWFEVATNDQTKWPEKKNVIELPRLLSDGLLRQATEAPEAELHKRWADASKFFRMLTRAITKAGKKNFFVV
eukprot:GHVT01022839.1.p1 GENE.GHVT01022839.1~~GHVT01022839.1.p1  ORF type:complete len:419 (+),score=151.57 GHVT01022839.1:172-1428(+)